MNHPTIAMRFCEIQAAAYAGAGLVERGDDIARQHARRLARLITREAIALHQALDPRTQQNAA